MCRCPECNSGDWVKIGQRLFIGFAIIIIINLLASALIINNIQNVQKYYQSKKAADNLVNDLKDSMLVEKEFRSAYDTGLVVDFQLEYKNITRDIYEMETSGMDYGTGVNFSGIRSSVQQYHDLILNNNNYLYSTENTWRTEENIVSSPGGIYQNSADIKARVLELSLGRNNSAEGVRYLYDMQQDERNYLSTHDAAYLADIHDIQNKTLEWSGGDPELAQDIWRYDNNLDVLGGLYAHQADTSGKIDGVVSGLENDMVSLGTDVNARFEDMLARTTATVVAVLVLSVLSSIVISLFITRTISRPIEYLARASERIALGDLRAKVEEKGNDEVASLSRSMQKMVKSMRERIEFNDALIRNIVDAQSIVDNEGNIFYVNEPMLGLAGYDFSEIINQDYRLYFENLPDLSGIRSDISCPCRLVKKGGIKADAACRLSILKDGEGARVGTIVLVRTDR